MKTPRTRRAYRWWGYMDAITGIPYRYVGRWSPVLRRAYSKGYETGLREVEPCSP